MVGPTMGSSRMSGTMKSPPGYSMVYFGALAGGIHPSLYGKSVYIPGWTGNFDFTSRAIS